MSAKPISQVFFHAWHEVRALIRETTALAKAQLSHQAGRIGIGIGLMAAALVLVMGLIPLLVLAFVYGLVALGIWVWAAYLITAGVAALMACALVLIGRRVFAKTAAESRATMDQIKASMAAITAPPPSRQAGDQSAGPGGSAATSPDWGT